MLEDKNPKGSSLVHLQSLAAPPMFSAMVYEVSICRTPVLASTRCLGEINMIRSNRREEHRTDQNKTNRSLRVYSVPVT